MLFRSELAVCLSKLPNLEILDARDNQIAKLPNSWATKKVKITQLLLSYNHINHLPDYIGRFVRLEYLEFAGNRIEKVPNSLSKLAALHYIDISYNPKIDLAQFITVIANVKL